MAFQPQWYVLDATTPVAVPGWYSSDLGPQDANWWSGLLQLRLGPLLSEAKVMVCDGERGVVRLGDQHNNAMTLGRWHGGEPLPPNPIQRGDALHTACFLVRDSKRWFRSQRIFYLHSHGSSHYIKARPNDGMRNTKDVYVHRLLCYMYRGPAEQPGLVAGHLCEHKNCVCPWHLQYMTDGENKARAYARQKGKAWQQAEQPG